MITSNMHRKLAAAMIRANQSGYTNSTQRQRSAAGMGHLQCMNYHPLSYLAVFFLRITFLLLQGQGLQRQQQSCVRKVLAGQLQNAGSWLTVPSGGRRL
jgi:hypothetical protein